MGCPLVLSFLEPEEYTFKAPNTEKLNLQVKTAHNESCYLDLQYLLLVFVFQHNTVQEHNNYIYLGRIPCFMFSGGAT